MPSFLYNLLLILVAGGVFLMLATAVINILMMVPYVPSSKKVVKHLVKIAGLKPGEKVYDLGCGDGRILIEAEKKARVKAVGYEAAPIPFILALIRKALSRSKARILMKNFFGQNLRDADVIFCYLGPDSKHRLAEKLKKECRAGTRIFSHTFNIEELQLKKFWPKNEAAGLPSIYYYEI
jgi:SAM-dependent methyltransferase